VRRADRPKERARVRDKIADHVRRFVRSVHEDLEPPEFFGHDLTAYVERMSPGAVESPMRIMRLLRERDELGFQVEAIGNSGRYRVSAAPAARRDDVPPDPKESRPWTAGRVKAGVIPEPGQDRPGANYSAGSPDRAPAEPSRPAAATPRDRGPGVQVDFATWLDE
jgi:hypothetical protein